MIQQNSVKTSVVRPSGEKLKQLKAARESCRANLKIMPSDPVCLHLLGLIECQMGHSVSAMRWLKKSIAAKPNSPDALCHYAVVLMERSRFAEAIEALQQATTLNPQHADAFYHLANAFKAVNDSARAEEAYNNVLALNPRHAEALNNLGTVLNNQKRYAEAIGFFRRAIAAKPDYVMAYNNIGVTLAALDMLSEAEAFYNHALQLKPDYPEAWNNLGIVYRLYGRFEDGRDCFRKALALRPDYPEACNNLGNALKDCGQLDEAIMSYRQAIQLKDTADNRHNLSLALMAAGDLREGWREYESRWGSTQLSTGVRTFTQPLWLGEPAEGKTILLHAEQGFGDTIQFCRYASLVAKCGLRVILEVQPTLVSLAKSLAGVETVIACGQPLPDFDLHCPLLSLPLAFNISLDTVPAPISYLSGDNKAISAWRSRLAKDAGFLKVGLVWSGKPQRQTPDLAATDRRRSMSPSYLTPLAGIDGVKFYSLQKGGLAPPAALKLTDYVCECHDFAATAALVANLDLVISVDTAVAHLAAAIGKPVWLLNRFDTCWRWLRDREDSPWYPNLRIFRQSHSGDWKSVIARVRTELERLPKPALLSDGAGLVEKLLVSIATPARISPRDAQGQELH